MFWLLARLLRHYIVLGIFIPTFFGNEITSPVNPAKTGGND
jgi:hypothetical protein